MESYKTYIKPQGTKGCDTASQYHLLFGFEMVYGTRSCFPVDNFSSMCSGNKGKSKQIHTMTKIYFPEKIIKYVEFRSLYQKILFTSVHKHGKELS